MQNILEDYNTLYKTETILEFYKWNMNSFSKQGVLV